MGAPNVKVSGSIARGLGVATLPRIDQLDRFALVTVLVSACERGVRVGFPSA
jgi:hypothetical protein